MDVIPERIKLGKRLKVIRVSRYKHLSKNKISKLSGLHRSIIDRIENGTGRFGYTIDSLLKYRSTFKHKPK